MTSVTRLQRDLPRGASFSESEIVPGDESARHVGESGSQPRPIHVSWVHDTARLIGGCEHYMVKTARLLRDQGIRSTLLYGESEGGPLDMLEAFDQAFPIVDLNAQLDVIDPDILYSHRLPGPETLRAMQVSGVPTLRFFHDHKLFCPREHKYTAIRKVTCSKSIGANCYACLGVITKSESWPGVRLSTVGDLRREHKAHRFMDGYVVGSQYMADHLAAHDFDRQKIHVLPLFADAPKPSMKTGRDHKMLLFVGQIVRGKGLDLLLRALANTDENVRLTIVGSGAQQAEMERLAHAVGVASRVTFAGKKSQGELASLYRKAGCLVIPSRSPETFGQVGIEAMSHGLPAIATRVGGISEWLDDGANGLFSEPNDPLSLAAAIDRFVSNPALAARLSENALKDYTRRFRTSLHISRLATLLRSTSSAKEQT